MKKGIIVFVILICLVIAGSFGINEIAKRTVYNNEYTLGNSSGNLLNGGTFCESDERIYFSNFNDNGSLYSMDLNCGDFEKIHNDKPAFINVTGPYVFYSRINNTKPKDQQSILRYRNTGLFRINKKDGKNIKTLYDYPTGIVNVSGNYVYYQHYEKGADGIEIYKIKIDGKEEELITSEQIATNAIQNNHIYYSGVFEDNYLYSMDLTTKVAEPIFDKDSCFNPVLNNDYLYYMSGNEDYGIARVKLDGSNRTVLIKSRCSTYNISADGRYIYYQVDDGKNNGLRRLDLNTQKVVKIRSGNFKNIQITSNYIFFTEFDSSKTYALSAGSGKEVQEFTPPALTENKK